MPPLLALPFPAIDPVAIAIGPIAIKWYALAYVVGMLGCWFYSRQLVEAERLWGGVKRPSPADMDDLIVWIAFGVVLGGRIGYVLFYNLGSYLEHPGDILAIWRGGMSFHGGFLGTVLAMVLFARSRGVRVLSVFDLAGVVTPLALLFGRLANFVNGELWGRPAPDLSFAVVFPNAGPLPRHPSQLYEAFAEGVVLSLVMAVAVRAFGFRRPGLLAGLFAVGYATARIVCEFFREPDEQLGFLFGRSVSVLEGGITMGMLLSIPMALAGLVVIGLALRSHNNAARGASAPEAPAR